MPGPRHVHAGIDQQRHHVFVMNLLHRFLQVFFAVASCIFVPGCLIQHSKPIKSDATVDPRLEGVWVCQEKLPEEIRTEGDSSDVGVSGYLIFARVDDDTYKVMAIDSFEKEEANIVMPEMLVSTRKYQQYTFISVRLPENEKEKAKKEKGGTPFKNWLLDYEIDSKGQLFLRYIDTMDKVLAAHPVKFETKEGGFEPVTMTGSEEEILNLYSDPKVRALFASCGKYRKLQLPAE